MKNKFLTEIYQWMRLAHHENKEENVVLEDSASHRLSQRIMHSEPEDVILVASTSYGRRCKKFIYEKGG